MIGQFDYSQKGWVRGKGRSAEWRKIDFGRKRIEPQYLMSKKGFIENNSTPHERGKLALLAIGSATNARTAVSAYIPAFPCGHSLAVLQPNGGDLERLSLLAMLNSFCYDFSLRSRVGGLNLSHFILMETPLLRKEVVLENKTLLLSAARLSWVDKIFSTQWLGLARKYQHLSLKPWTQWWAITDHERLRLRCLLDAIIADLYGLNLTDLQWVFSQCDQPSTVIRSSTFMRTLDPKGFWRVDKELDPELRHTVLSLVAFHDLKRMGMKAFLEQNDGEGWMLPETLRLADYGLGHDDRAQEPQPVASRLGPRFLDWQLSQGVEESWAECARHAEILSKLLPPPPPATDQAAMASVEQPATSAEPTAVQAAFAFALTPPEPKPGHRRPAKN